jgi:hypothetical protein
MGTVIGENSRPRNTTLCALEVSVQKNGSGFFCRAPALPLRLGMLRNATAHLPDLLGKSRAVPGAFSDPASALGADEKKLTPS